MYIILNIVNNELLITTNMEIVTAITNIPYSTLTNTFSRKKLDKLEYLKFIIYKQKPLKLTDLKNPTPKIQTEKKTSKTKK